MGRRWVIIIVALFAAPALVISVLFLFVIAGGPVNIARCFEPGTVIAPASIEVDGSDLLIDGVSLKGEQVTHAETIIGVGVSRGFSQRDIAIAVATAYQESNLRNIAFGDRDSLGLFQQRPSQGWGSASQILDPVYASNKFYDALARVQDRDATSMIEVAIKVQRPSRRAYEDRWRWDAMATALVQRSLGDQSPEVQLANGTLPQSVGPDLTGCNGATGSVQVAIEAAKSQIGTPYLWGGESETDGFDCSGLMQWAYQKAGVELPRTSRQQYAAGTKVSRDELLPGDLVFMARDKSDPSTIYHMAMWLGNEQILEARQTGTLISINPMRWDNFIGATRPITEPVELTAALTGGWQLPLRDNYRLSSPFNPNRLHPIHKVVRAHNGTDFAAPNGTPVYAVAAGTVTRASHAGGYGNYVVIDHGGGIMSAYAHLQGYADGLGQGDTVQAGTVVGYVGSTGGSTGNHLHFEIKVDGRFVDPIPFLREKGLRP